MSFFLLVLWLQMSAPTMPCQSAKLYYNGVLVDEEPRCGFLMQPIMPSALDDITRAEFAEAAQRAADETDEKPCKMDDGAPCEYKAYVGKIPEPVDVPAVQVTKSHNSCFGYIYASPDLSAKERDAVCMVPTTTHTCADKSRILEHDENSPPKYWCRKVQQ